MKKLILPSAVLLTLLFLSSACNKNENGDQNAPYIEMNPPNPLYWALDYPYEDPGAEAYDITEVGDTVNITSSLIINNNVDVAIAGDYQVTYNVTDEAGNSAEQQVREVKVVLSK